MDSGWHRQKKKKKKKHNVRAEGFVSFSCSVLSSSLRPNGLRHTSLLYHSLSPRIYSNSCPLSQWCHPIIYSSVTPFYSCPQVFLGSVCFPMSQFFESSGQSIWNFSLSVSPFNDYSGLISFRIDWFELLTDQETLKHLLQHHSLKALIPQCSIFFKDELSHLYMTTRKTAPLTTRTFNGKGMFLLFNMLSMFVIAFLPRIKCLLISWLQSMSVVVLDPKKIKFITISLSVCPDVIKPATMSLVFWVLNFKPAFSLSFFTFISRLFTFSLFSAIKWYHLHIWGYGYFSQLSWCQNMVHPVWHSIWCTLNIS